MQTFLPYSDFTRTAKCLDRQRLGKQRVEALQIMRTLKGVSSGWANHTAVKMWRGYEPLLALYALEICSEWVLRGYVDNCWKQINELSNWRDAVSVPISQPHIPGGSLGPVNTNGSWHLRNKPAWLGDEAFHASHRSNLLRKLPEHYSKFGWTEPDNLEYIWPVK